MRGQHRSALAPDPEAERLLAAIRVSEWARLSARTPLDEARRAAAEGRWEEALERMLAVVRDDPEARESMLDVFAELVVEFARRWQAKVIVKGLRVISDFEWEFQMNQLNRTLAPEIETVYVMASPQVSFVSSSGVKEIAAFGGSVDEFVPERVAQRFKELFPNGRPGTPENPAE